MVYYCKRCGKNTNHLGDLKKHLKNKKQCEPLYADVDRAILLEELATPAGKGGFMVKMSDKIVKLEDVEDKDEFVTKIQEDLIKLKRENIKLKKEVNDLTTAKGGVTNNNINITHIHLNNFYKEDTSYITDDCLSKMLVKVYESVPSVIKAIHFNPEHPENHNVKMPNKRDKFMMVRRNNEWSHENKREVIKDLVSKGHGFIDSRCNDSLLERMNSLQRHTFDNLMKELEDSLANGESGEVHKDLCARMEAMLLNVKENTLAV